MPYLLLILAITAGSVIVGATAVYFLRARFRETVEAASRPTLASSAAPALVQTIGDQIERVMAEQRIQDETQRRAFAQKLDRVCQSVDSQRAHIDGLRHELRRRDAEMEAIRHQIGLLHPASAQPASASPALPAADAPVMGPAPADPPAGPFDDDPFGDGSFGQTSFGDSAAGLDAAPPPDDALGLSVFGDSGAFEADSVFSAWVPQPPAAPPAAPPPVEIATFSPTETEPPDAVADYETVDDADATATSEWSHDGPSQLDEAEASFEEVAFGAPADEAPADAPTFDATPPPIDPSWIARPDRPAADARDTPLVASADDFFSFPADPEPDGDMPTGLADLDALVPAAQTAVAPDPAGDPADPFQAPADADDLTVISTIDEDVQRLLYLEGVTSLEEIAQWSRTRARQIALRVEISEETIMTQWVFEAQAAMFNQFSSQASV